MSRALWGRVKTTTPAVEVEDKYMRKKVNGHQAVQDEKYAYANRRMSLEPVVVRAPL